MRHLFVDVSSVRNGNVKPVCVIEFDYRNVIVIIKRPIVKFLIVFCFCVEKLLEGGSETINYQDHQYCQMGVGLSYVKVRKCKQAFSELVCC